MRCTRCTADQDQPICAHCQAIIAAGNEWHERRLRAADEALARLRQHPAYLVERERK